MRQKDAEIACGEAFCETPVPQLEKLCKVCNLVSYDQKYARLGIANIRPPYEMRDAIRFGADVIEPF